MTRGWALRALACLAAGAVLVGGCSEKQEAGKAGPTTSSAEASPTLPPLGPPDFPVPAEARQKTEAGVRAFTRYYVQLTNELASHLDSEPLRQLSQNCEGCDQLADSYDRDRAAGYHYNGGNVSVVSTGSVVITGESAEISFLLQQEPVQVFDASGSLVQDKSSLGYQLSGGMRLAWDPTQVCWLATQLDADRI